MVWSDLITKIDESITIGIHGSHEVVGIHNEISTVPSTWTFVYWEWTITISETEFFWTVFSSPVVFDIDNTLVHFTHIDGTIIIGITVH